MTQAASSLAVAHVVNEGSDNRFKVFVSYSRTDSEAFAAELVSALDAEGLSTRIDTRDLEFGEQWQSQLSDFIREADAVIYVVSPGSIASRWCRWEIAQVATQSKRLVPVVHISVLPTDLPAEIGAIQLFHMRPQKDYAAAEEYHSLTRRLVQGLLKDRAWLQEHTRIGGLAHTWLATDRSSDLLLHGRALRDAETWMVRRPDSAPPPSQSHLEFIAASQALAKRTARRWTGLLTAIAMGSLTLSGVALWQWYEANRQRSIAEVKTEEATESLKQARLNESRLLARLARQEREQGDRATAIGLALEALPTPEDRLGRPLAGEAVTELLEALRSPAAFEVSVLHLPGAPLSVAFDPNGRIAATASTTSDESDHVARLFDADTGVLIATLVGHSEQVAFLGFSQNGQHLFTIGDQTLRVWDVAKRTELAWLRTDTGFFTAATFSRTGAIWFGHTDGSVGVWDWHRRESDKRVLGKHAKGVDRLLESEIGDRLVSISDDAKVMVFDTWHKQQLGGSEFPTLDKALFGFDAHLHPEGTKLMVLSLGGYQPKGGIWDVPSGLKSEDLAPPERTSAELASGAPQELGFVTADYSLREPLIAYRQDLGRVRLSSDVVLATREQDVVFRGAFTPNRQKFVGTTEPGKVHLWRERGDAVAAADWSEKPLVLVAHTGRIVDLVVRENAFRMMTASSDGTVRIWRTEPDQESDKKLKGFENRESDGALSLSRAIDLVQIGRETVARCLAPDQRRAFLLPPSPPSWCITGATKLSERSPEAWTSKWPYHTSVWREQLLASRTPERRSHPAGNKSLVK